MVAICKANFWRLNRNYQQLPLLSGLDSDLTWRPIPQIWRRHLGAGLLAVIMALAAGCAPRDEAPRVVVTKATLWPGLVSAPGSADRGLSLDVDLPDYWARERRHQAIQGWYRAQADLLPLGQLLANNETLQSGAEPDKALLAEDPLALLMGNHSGVVRVYWNNKLVGANTIPSGMGVPVIAGPLLAVLPTQTKSGPHQLDIAYRGHPTNFGFVHPIVIGRYSDLQRDYARKRLLVSSAPIALCILSLFAVVVFYAAYRRDRGVPGAGWLCLGLAFAAISHLGLYFSPPEELATLAGRIRPMLYHLSFGCYLFAVHTLRGVRRSVLERGVLILFGGFALALLLVPPLDVYAVAVIWTMVTLPLAAYTLYQAARLALSGSTAERWVLVPVIGVFAIFGHDVAGVLQGGRYWAGQALNVYISAVVAFTLILMIIVRARAHLAETVVANAQLEQRVAQKHAELEANYQRLASYERREAATSERERMVRDMHDGLGGQLVSTLAMVESGNFSAAEIEDALRDSLDDLRLMVNSLTWEAADVNTLLGSMRARVGERIERQGIEFSWQVAYLPELPVLGPESAGHVARIVQEAFTNVLKHANARSIRVKTAIDQGQLLLTIEDDGVGFAAKAGDCAPDPASDSATGRGLANMRYRAEQLHGNLQVHSPISEQRGTRISLRLPLTPQD